VAAHILRLAASEQEPELVSHLRLQKLLYYVQGWSLGLRGRPLFRDRIEAWTDGPVVPAVYRATLACKHQAIDAGSFGAADPLSEEDQVLVGQVWTTYRPYSALSLRDMTHREPPWRDARADVADGAPSNREIARDALRSYFASLAAKLPEQ
jgi:uncharacterized phage-associated protein